MPYIKTIFIFSFNDPPLPYFIPPPFLYSPPPFSFIRICAFVFRVFVRRQMNPMDQTDNGIEGGGNAPAISPPS